MQVANLHPMATTRTADKSAQSEDLENKSLEPATVEANPVTATLEPEAPAPNRLGNVHVIIAHPLKAGRVKDEAVKPGDRVTVNADRARELVAAGAASYVK